MNAMGISASYTNASVYNLALIFFTVFICPLFPPSYLSILYPACSSGIFILIALSMEKKRRDHIIASVVMIMLTWISIATENDILRGITRLLQFFFFLYLLLIMVFEIARNSKVNIQVIINAVTGYFLLGLAFSTMVVFVAALVPDSYNIVHDVKVEKYEPLKDYFYYAFITYTTTGYGDIVPIRPISKSLAILIGVSGQLYIAVIISMLIGKFSSRRTE